MVQIIKGLSEIAPDYEAVLCDVWGVIHNGRAAFAASVDALIQFRKTRGPVVLITNSPRPASEIPAQFEQIGVDPACYDAIVTSGDATRAILRGHAPGPVYILGPDRDLPLYAGLNLEKTELDDAAFISCTGLFNDAVEHPAEYHDLLARAHMRNLPMVCANPDVEVMVGDRRIWCGGALAQMYQQMGGEVLYVGKPHAPIYNLSFLALSTCAGREIIPRKVLAIGDGMGTDVKGAEAAGIDCLFVATGIHANALNAAGELDVKTLAADLATEKTQARFGAPGLVW